MAKERLAVTEMVMNLVLGKNQTDGRVTYFPQKPSFWETYGSQEQPFERATPESQGIESEHLRMLLLKLATSPGMDMHHFMVLRHGKVICECDFAPYPRGMWHITHSMCKSITGMAIGMLIEEGKLSLEENIYDIFADRMSSLVKLFRPEITVEQLLTMTSLVSFNESGAVSGNDWLGGYLSAAVTGKPGSAFAYNSMNSYVLSAIVTKRTGVSLAEYLKPRLFEPLGITHYLWETCPMGVTKGGWGLFLAAEDMAKLGQLYLQHGVWKGQQLVPEHWVAESTRKHVESTEGTYGYGYQLWMEQRPDSFEFNGMLGQNVVVYPDLDMVLVTNAANNELFQDCAMLGVIRSCFPPEYQPGDAALPENPVAYQSLQRLCERLAKNESLPKIQSGGWKKQQRGRTKEAEVCRVETSFRHLAGRTYELQQKHVGIVPLLMQVFHNNMSAGIESVSFAMEAGHCYVCFREGEDLHRICIGFGRPVQQTLTVRGEYYEIAAEGGFTKDERGRMVLRLDMAFLEEAARRSVYLFFEKDTVELRWYEFPGKTMIMDGIGSVTDELSSNPLFGLLKDREAVESVIHRLMESTIEPVVFGKLKQERSE